MILREGARGDGLVWCLCALVAAVAAVVVMLIVKQQKNNTQIASQGVSCVYLESNAKKRH